MKVDGKVIKSLIQKLGYKPLSDDDKVFYKQYSDHNSYMIKVDFNSSKIIYGSKIKVGDKTTSNFSSSENFVVLECVDRLLRKGYPPERLSLEHKWPMGRKEKGKLDILVLDENSKAYLMVECKTWGVEFNKEQKKMVRDGGQLFSYFLQDKSAEYLCLYASRLDGELVEYRNEIVKCDPLWITLTNQKEIHDHWNKNFKDNGVFDDWANSYDVEIRSLVRESLKELTQEDSGIIFNQFAEILRHNVVSDKPNAFNKIFNLFLCKVVDEDRKPDEELHFQWLDNDTHIDLQKRLSDLYKQGMKEYLTKEITDYSEKQLDEKILTLDSESREYIREMFTRIRLHKNNEFAFKEVFDEKSFGENAIVVKEVIELLQPFQIRYGHKQQFLGDFFELLLSTGIKQEAGQFFTPVPIAKFIISSLPVRETINEKISKKENNFLPYIIDYSAGSGHFLTESMDEVQKIIDSMEEKKHKPSTKAKLSSWKASPFDWAYDYVYGIEADYRLVKTAKVSCFLNGDGLANVIHADGLDSFKCSEDYKGKLNEYSQEDSRDNSQFDILVANPPYSVSAFKNTIRNGEESFSLFEHLTDDSSEIECLFVERTKQLLKPGGKAGVILPNSFIDKSGVSAAARELLFKYFKIRSIVELGTSTFMATGVKTAVFFLERRENNEWKTFEKVIEKFISTGKDQKLEGIKNSFESYVVNIFGDFSVVDYHSLLVRNPSDKIKSADLYKNYSDWFSELNEILLLKGESNFKEMDINDQEELLGGLFLDKVIEIEKKRLLYYFLTFSQDLVLVKTNVGEGISKEEKKKEAQDEKRFIGYDFSNRRGHEGIRMNVSDSGNFTTSLYDDNNHKNPEKINSYIYSSFLESIPPISENLKNNVKIIRLYKIIDFKNANFNNSISIGTEASKKEIKKDAIDLKFTELTDGIDTKSLNKIISLQNGKGLSKSKMQKGDCTVYGGNGITGTHSDFICEQRTIAIGRVGAYCGAVHLTKEKSWITDNSMFIKSFENGVDLDYLFFALRNLNLNQHASQSSHPNIKQPTVLSKKIPFPKDIEAQRLIAKELNEMYRKS